jgi:phage virion morphogenesis protein
VAKSITIPIANTSPGEIARGIAAAVQITYNDIQSVNWISILSDLVPYLERVHREHFDNQSAPDGTPWEPLSPYTVAKKGFDQVLRESGRLRGSLTRRGAGAVRRVKQRELVYGTRVPYASFHQSGFRNARTNTRVPARPMVGVGPEHVRAIAERVADSIIRQL